MSERFLIVERKSSINPQVKILDLSGKVMLGDGSVKLRNKIRELLQCGDQQILLNFQFQKLSYVDSSGIGEFVSSFTAVNKEGGTLKLLNLSEDLVNLFSATRLLSIFEVFDEEETALKSF